MVVPIELVPVPARTRDVPTRRISFDDSLKNVPRHFAADDDLIMSHVIATLSSVFPDGEDYFVRSVREYRDKVNEYAADPASGESGPKLKTDVAGFIGQESTHGRVHRTLNDRFAELGYPSERVERWTKAGLGWRTRTFSPIFNLASTAALEHFTATLAEILLRDEEARNQIGSPEVLDLLCWHALEECEHKAVAFDVYRLAGGTEKQRKRVMNLTIVGFLVGMSIETLISMLFDGATYRRGNLRRSIGRLRRSPFMKREVWNLLRDYNRTGFHPDDHQTDELLEHWREKLFGINGRLNHLLVNAA